MSELVVLGWPVDEVRRKALQALNGGKPLPMYAGSIQAVCANCGQAVYIGPRGREVLESQPAKPMCPVCALVLAPEGTAVVNLGNPNDLSLDSSKEPA